MQITNEVYPSALDQTEAANDAEPEGPIAMVNLLKFHPRARYRDGSDPDLSGADAYGRYREGIAAMIGEYGGRVLFAGHIGFVKLGIADEMWDEIFIGEMPDRAALNAMVGSTQWRGIAHHREAGLAGELAIETTHIDGFLTAVSPAR